MRKDNFINHIINILANSYSCRCLVYSLPTAEPNLVVDKGSACGSSEKGERQADPQVS